MRLVVGRGVVADEGAARQTPEDLVRAQDQEHERVVRVGRADRRGQRRAVHPELALQPVVDEQVAPQVGDEPDQVVEVDEPDLDARGDAHAATPSPRGPAGGGRSRARGPRARGPRRAAPATTVRSTWTSTSSSEYHAHDGMPQGSVCSTGACRRDVRPQVASAARPGRAPRAARASVEVRRHAATRTTSTQYECRRLTTTTRGSPPAADHPVTSSSHGTGSVRRGGALVHVGRVEPHDGARRAGRRATAQHSPSARTWQPQGAPDDDPRRREPRTAEPAEAADAPQHPGGLRPARPPPRVARCARRATAPRVGARREPEGGDGERCREPGSGGERGRAEADGARAPGRDEDRRPQRRRRRPWRRGGEQAGQEGPVGAALDGARGRDEQRHAPRRAAPARAWPRGARPPARLPARRSPPATGRARRGRSPPSAARARPAGRAHRRRRARRRPARRPRRPRAPAPGRRSARRPRAGRRRPTRGPTATKRPNAVAGSSSAVTRRSSAATRGSRSTAGGRTSARARPRRGCRAACVASSQPARIALDLRRAGGAPRPRGSPSSPACELGEDRADGVVGVQPLGVVVHARGVEQVPDPRDAVDAQRLAGRVVERRATARSGCSLSCRTNGSTARRSSSPTSGCPRKYAIAFA